MKTTQDPVITSSEQVIRSFAASVLNSVRNRQDHPTYGYTKGKIRAEVANMEGAIGLYMVLRHQATHAGVPTLARFSSDSGTQELVDRARAAVASL